MELFHIIEDGVVHLRSKGFYREAKVYRRGRDVFAKHGAGFIRLHGSSGTSVSNVSWDALDAPGVTFTRIGGQPGFAESVTTAPAARAA